MKKIFLLFTALILIFAGCGLFEEDNEGSISLNLTDAPSLDDITSININISKVTVSVDDEWYTLIDFDESEESGAFNLLDFQQGEVAPLAEDVSIPSGTIGQIRFYLDASEDESTTSSSTVVMTDSTEYDLVIPSSAQSGLKLIAGFDMPSNGDVEITADFDARKSLNFKTTYYKMKPTIRLIVEGEAGHISGTVSGDFSSYENIAVYAYEDGTWDDTELDFDESAEELPFLDSISASAINDDDTYKVAYLAAGTYDLVLAGFADGDTAFTKIAELPDVEVISGETTVDQTVTVP